MNTTSNIQVAQTIADQIGKRAFFMMGAKNLVGDANTLRFQISGCREISHVIVTLNGSDLYDVQFIKCRGIAFRVVATDSGVYAEDLNRIIESRTGLYLSL